MTIAQAMAILDQRKPNEYLFEERIQWLSQLDWRIVKEVFNTHRGDDGASFTGYTADVDRNTELLVGQPYDDMYITYMCLMIDMINGETARYNNDVTIFNQQFSDFANAYNRTHNPIGQTMLYY